MVKRTWASADDGMQPQEGRPVDDDVRKRVERYDGDLDEDEAIFDAAWNEVLKQESKKNESR